MDVRKLYKSRTTSMTKGVVVVQAMRCCSGVCRPMERPTHTPCILDAPLLLVRSGPPPNGYGMRCTRDDVVTCLQEDF